MLYDAGLSPKAVRQNLEVMQIDAGNFRAIVISHGHADHHGGLEGVLQRRVTELTAPRALRLQERRFPRVLDDAPIIRR